MPTDFLYLERQISQIGSKLVSCQRDCAGISRDQEKGILPRCLILETEGRDEHKGLVIVGINPKWSKSGAKSQERKFYREHGGTYEQVVEYWRTRIKPKHRYYSPLRKFADLLCADGQILWTERVKCENAPKNKREPPVQTLRTCIQTYLQEELKVAPDDWLLLAIGRNAFERMALLCPHRTVIGIPHPASFGHFSHVYSIATKGFKGMWDGPRGVAIWLDDYFSGRSR